jgi:hypothetical protein
VEQLSSHWMEFDGIWSLCLFGMSVEKIQDYLNSKRIRVRPTLYENFFTFMTISRWILLRMRNVWDKSCGKNQNTHFIFNNFFSIIVPFVR